MLLDDESLVDPDAKGEEALVHFDDVRSDSLDDLVGLARAAGVPEQELAERIDLSGIRREILFVGMSTWVKASIDVSISTCCGGTGWVPTGTVLS